VEPPRRSASSLTSPPPSLLSLIRRDAGSDFAARRLYRTVQGFNPGSRIARDPACLSAVVLGKRDEGGKVAAEVGLQALHVLFHRRAHNRVPLSGHLSPTP
jgi:hypothetical protein